jgi:prevent-host-death family protein
MSHYEKNRFDSREKQMKTKKTAKFIPALTARTQFRQILKRVRHNKENFIVSDKGEAQAVIISMEEYLRSIVPTPEPLRAIQAAAKAKGLDKLTMRQIDTEIRKSRRERRAKK